MKPRLLDLFCGAGGAAVGYARAGLDVVGVDIEPQPNYCGDEFVQADALAVSVAEQREAMAIDWMTRAELSQAIPPAYTQFIGEQMIRLPAHTHRGSE